VVPGAAPALAKAGVGGFETGVPGQRPSRGSTPAAAALKAALAECFAAAYEAGSFLRQLEACALSQIQDE